MKRGPTILKYVLRIYIIHIGAVLAVWLGMYFPGVDVLLAILYLFLICKEGEYAWTIMHNRFKQVLIAMLWQLPGLVLSGSILLGLDRLTEFAYYFIFILELWETPVLPLVSLLPVWSVSGRPIYYYLLFILVLVLGLIYYLPAVRSRKS